MSVPPNESLPCAASAVSSSTSAINASRARRTSDRIEQYGSLFISELSDYSGRRFGPNRIAHRVGEGIGSRRGENTKELRADQILTQNSSRRCCEHVSATRRREVLHGISSEALNLGSTDILA